MKKVWIEVFRTGKHTAMNGVTKDYTEQDLDNFVSKFGETPGYKAPLVIGHPAVEDPAYGWAEQLKRVGSKLFAYVEPVSEKIVEAVRSGMFKRLSIALYADGLLRHIGLLGAHPPAVKGLAPVEFAADQAFAEFEIDAGDIEEQKITFKEFKAFFAELFSKGPDGPTNHNQEDDMNKEEVTALLAANTEAMAKTFAAQLAGAVAPIMTEIGTIKQSVAEQGVAFSKQIQDQQFVGSVEGFTAFCGQMVAEGRLLPAEVDEQIDTYKDLLRGEGNLQFAEGEKRPTVKLRDRIQARAQVIKPRASVFAEASRAKKTDGKVDPMADQFAETGKEVNDVGIDIDQQITAYAEKHKVSYEEATVAFMAGKE